MYRLIQITSLSFCTIIFFVIASSIYGQDYPDEFLNGEIHKIQSKILQQERIILVYLPTDYDRSNNSYPVHYITDAPATANLFFDLIRLHTHAFVNEMPQSIVIGLQSDGREFNLHPEKGAKKYLDFVEREVIPFIEQKYRTKPFRTIAGHSLGGGFAIYAFLSRTNLFNLCIAGSPYPLEYLTNMIAREDVLNGTSAYRFLYSSMGTVNDSPVLQLENFKQAFIDKAPQNVQYSFQINEGVSHISNVALNFQAGLKAFYKDWKFVLPDTLSASIDVMLSNHYKSLSQKVGYSVKPGEWEVIFPIMDKLAKRSDFKNAIQILKYCTELYPQSDQAYAFLARAYMSAGEQESAQANLEKALSINPQNKFALQIKSMLNK